MKPFRKVAPALALLAIVAVVAVLTFRSAPVVPQTGPAGVAAPSAATVSTPAAANGPATQPTAVSGPAVPAEPGLDGFRRWAEEFARAGAADRGALAAEGRKLVAERRRAMQDLIRKDPQAAIAQALPFELREALPADIAGLIEHPVRARGDLSVMGAFGGDASAPRASYERVAHVGGRDYQAFVYGSRVDQMTTSNDHLLGVAVDDALNGGVIALREESHEVVSKAEADRILATKTLWARAFAAHAKSGEDAVTKADETVVVTGDGPALFCCALHAGQSASTNFVDALGGAIPSTGRSAVVPPTHAQGDKRFLVVRLRFANQASDFEPISDSALRDKLEMSRDTFARWSYGKLQSEFVYTPVFTAPRTEEEYAALSSPESQMTRDMLEIAAAYAEGGQFPYNATNFNFRCMVFESDKVGTRYCGLAQVGGVDSWMRCAWSISVFAHEWGHNFSLRHANHWEATSPDPIGPGVHREYGGRYSTMHAWFATDNPISPAFNTGERWQMGWLSTNDVPTVRTGGVYRIYSAEATNLVAGRLYGLRIPKDHRSYAFEYRPDFRADGVREFFTDNGLVVMWHANQVPFTSGAEGTQVLDMHPRTYGDGESGTVDSPLLVGRTFTDPLARLSVTPLRVGGSGREKYIEVEVRAGIPLSNSPPVALARAASQTVAVNAPLALSVTSADPDGDAVSIFWDFGDGTYSADDSAAQEHRWSRAGDYVVRVDVSDRRGGVGSSRVVVRVGNPSTFTLSGRVATADGRPIANVLVTDAQRRQSLTDAEGRWTLTGVPAGASQVDFNASEWTVTPSFSNPLTVGGPLAGLDAVASPRRRIGLLQETWFNIPGLDVAFLLADPRYPGSPDQSFPIDRSSEPASNIAENYGLRLSGWFHATQTGPHALLTSSDDSSQVWISTDDSFDNLVKVAEAPRVSGYRNWTRYTSQRSAPIPLLAGRRYAFRAFLKEASGGDHLSIGLDLPDATAERPVAIGRFEPLLPAPPAPPAAEVFVAASVPTATEGGSAGAFRLSRTGDTASALTVFYTFTGTASPGADYEIPAFSAVIPAGSASVDVPLNAISDVPVESVEQVTLQLSPTTGYRVGSAFTASVQLLDNSPAEVSIAVVDGTASETGANTARFRVTRVGNSAGDITVNYTVSGTATSGVDFRALPGSVVLPAGQASADILLEPLSDELVEDAETVVLTVAAGSYTPAEPTSATASIELDVSPGRGILREWFSAIPNGFSVADLTTSPGFPDSPTGREIVTTAFESLVNRDERFGERWRAVYTAGGAGEHRFNIYADDAAELWFSEDPTGAGARVIASVRNATLRRSWTGRAGQESAGIQLAAGQKVYLEVRWVEATGGDSMGVGVRHPNGLLERPIPAHRLDPFTPNRTPLTAPWVARAVGAVPAGRAGFGLEPIVVPPVNRFRFDGVAGSRIESGSALRDESGGGDAVVRGPGARFAADGSGVSLPGGDIAFSAYIDLPNGIVSGTGSGSRRTAVSLETWVTFRGAGETPPNLFFSGTDMVGEVVGSIPAETPYAGLGLFPSFFEPQQDFQVLTRFDADRIEDPPFGGATSPLPRDRPVHIVLTYDATSRLWSYYRDGLGLISIPDPLGPGEIPDVNNWLGRGYFDFFPAMDGLFHEFRVYDYALSPSQIRGNTVAGPDAVGIPNPSPITLFGSGTLSTNAEDSFHFESQPVAGGVDLKVRLSSMVTTNASGTAGLMLRADAGPVAPHAFLGWSPGGTLRFLSRTNAGEVASLVQVSGVALPVWLRLERAGGSVVASHSADGTNWTRVASVPGLLVGDAVGDADGILAGLAAASPEPNSSAYAVFENLTVGRSATAATLAASSVGTRSATLRASVNPNGSPTTLFFEYGATTLYGRSSQTNNAGSGTDSAVVEIPVSGLTPHTTYQYQAVARSASGPFTGGNLEFTTLDTVPLAVDDVPAPLTSSSAVSLSVLANDSDADGDRLAIVSVTQGARGSVAIAAGGNRLTYDPADDFAGADEFTYTVSDGFGGTATATVRVQVPDTAAPTIAGSFSPLTVATGPAGTVLLPNFLAQATINDNVGVASTSQTPPAGTPVTVGTVEVQLAALDAAGNAGQRAVSVSVLDGTAPVLSSVPGPTDLAPGVTTLPDLTGGLVATDNVGVAARTQAPAAGTTLAVGVHTVTLTVRDAAGNTATADVRVTVNPVTPPTVAFARSPRNVDADAACSAVAPDLTTLADLVVTGGSGPYTFSQSLAVGTSLSLGSRYTNVTTVTGSDGAAAFATNVVVVRDVLAPVFTRVPADVSTNVAPGVLGIVPDLAALATATDCNGPVVFSQSVAAGTLQLPGARGILVHAVDASGNTNSVSVTFTVQEVLPAVAEIAVVGNGLVIADGDAEPDTGDHTDFGTVGTGGTSVVRTFSVRNTGNAPLVVGAIGVAGAHADEFTVAGPTLPATVPAGTNVDFTVSFAPGAGGLRIATVTVGSDAPDSPAYDFAVQGVGLEAASVTTLAATDAVGASARLHARIRARNATTAVTFQYGTNTSYGTEVPAVPATVSGDEETPVEAVLTGLVPGLEYHFRAVAVNTNGTAFGADLVFATATSAPNVAPVVAVASSVVSLPEGPTAQVSGTVSDADADTFVLTASIGAVAAGTEAGTWTWSGPAVDGSQVTITATDSHGAAGLTAFTLSVTNVPPLLASSGDVSVGEGSTAVRSGTWSDPGGDIVTLSASTGSVLKEDAGTWSWSLATTDGPEQGGNVTITATDADGGVRTTTFLLTVTNVVPAVTSAGAVAVGEGQVASNSGTWFDPGADTVSLTVSAGTVVRDASGSWTWAFTPADGPEATQTVTVTATDSDGAVGTSAFELTVTNLPPTVAAAGPVTVGEGLTATNTGTWGDPGADSVTLSASAGTVVKNANGTWSWSLATADGPEDGRTVTITATDSDGATATAAFDLVVENRPPVLANAGNRSVSAGATATNTGTWSDPGTDSVVLTASVGAVTRNDNGTWSWSFDTTGALSQQVVVTGTDADGLAATTAFNLSVDASTGATFVWNAAANGANWSTPSSWTVTAGSDDDGIPDANDAVVFNATRSTSSTVGASFAVKSVEVATGYGGAIALGANTLSVSAGFSVVPTGAFNPGNGTVRFVGSQDVSIPSVLVNVAVDGGAAVALKSDLTLWGNGTLSGNGRILNGGGRLLLGRGDQVGYVVNFTGTVDDLVLVPGFNADIALSTNLVVNGSLTVAEMRTLNGPGVLRVHGRATSTDTSWFNATSVQLVGSDDQPLNGTGIFNSLVVAKPSGDVVLTNDMTLAYGTLSGRGRIRNDGGRLILGKGDQNGYVVNFNGAVDDLVLVPGFNADIALNTNLVVNGSLLVGEIRTLLGPGVLHVNGRATSTDTSWGSTTSIRLVGTNDQLLNGTGMFNHLVVAKPGGDVVLTNDMTLAYGTLSGTGRIRNSGGRLVLGRGDQQGYVANFTGTVDDLVLVPGFNADIALSTNLVVSGSLTVAEMRTLNGPGVLRVHGRATSTDTSWFNATSLHLVGSGDQLLNGNGIFNSLVVAKPGGDVVLTNDMTLAYGALSGTGRIRNNGGRLVLGKGDQNGYVVNFTGTVDDVVFVPGFNADIALNTNLVVNGSLTVAEMRTLNGPGVLRVHGAASSFDASWFNATSVQLVGSNDQPLNGTGMFNTLVVAKTGGDVVLTNDMTLAYGTLSGTGRIRNNGGRLVLGRGDQNSYVVNFAGTVDDLTLVPGFNADIQLLQNLTLNGSLNVAEIRTLVGPGALRVNGTASSFDASWFANTTVQLVGTNHQVLNGTGMFNSLVVAKTGGDVLLTNDMTLAYGTLSGTGRIRNGGGRLLLGRNDQNGYVVDFGGTVDDVVLLPGFNADIALARNLTVPGTLSVAVIRSLNGPGLLRVEGDVTSSDNDVFGNGFVSLVGTADQRLLGTGRLGNLDISKPAGNVLMSTFNRSFGQVTVSSGSWDVLGNTVSAGSGFLVKGGAVTGVGTLVGVVTGQNHGVLAPGSATVGVLNTGSLVLNGETVFRARVNGTTGPGVDHDQLNVAGSVSLGNARLELSGSAAAPSDATQVVLVNNDSTDAVSGTFADLPQNAVVNLNGTAYRISYSGGTGNDVTLSAVGATTGTLVASLDAGTLTVTDSDSAGRPNRLGVVVSGTDLVVSDAAERFTDSVPSGATRSAGDRTLTIPLSAVTDRLVLNLAGGNDILTVDFSGGAFPFAVEFAGGAGTLDQLDLAGGAFSRMDLAYTNATSGRLSLDPAGSDPARDLSYAGVEHLILVRSGAEDVALRLPPVANNAVLEDEGGVGNRVSRLRSSNGTLTQVEFSSPTNAFTVLRGSEADALVVNDLPDLKSGLVAGSPSSPLAAVTVAGSVSPAVDRSIELFSNGTLNLSTANSDLATLGVGSIRLVSARDVVFTAGAAVSTINGPVVVEANLQSPPTAAGFVGIAVNGASIQSLGAGPVTLKGAPGSVGTNPAISVAAASTISSVSGRLEIAADSLALAGGSVSSLTGTVAVRPNSAGVAVTLGAADAAGVLGLTDTELDLLSGSRLELGSTNSGILTVSAAVTRPATTSLTLRGSAVNWTSAGSVDTSVGALSLDARGGAVTWSQPGAAVNAGSLQLSAGDLFRPALTSPTAVRTLNVVGEVRLGDAVLDLDNGGFAPVVGTSYLLVANDGMEPVVGTFRDLPEGSVVAVGGGLFTVTYVGGTGNDVVLGSVAPRPEIAIVTQAGAELVDGQATPIDFGLTSVGTPVVRSFVLRNRGSSTLTVSGASAPAGFQLAFIPSSVPAGGSTVFQVRMTAAAAGAFSGRVVVNSDDADEAAFDFPVVGVANTRPTQTVDLASVVVGEGSTAVNAGAFGDLDGDSVTLTASVGTLTRGGAAGTVDESTGPAWRTPSVAKAQDADGDNVYGTDGYALWGVNGVETVSNPAYATIQRNPALAFYGGFSPVPYVDIDDAANPTGPRRRTGVVYNQPGGTNVTVFATVTFSQAANVRLGILVDNADFSAISPTTLRVRRTSGAAYDTGHTQAGTPSSRNRSADYYFFDLTAEAGDVFEISGANDPGFGSNGIGGLFLDTRSGSLASAAGTWTWSLGTTDGPSETVVTLTADDGVNAPLVQTFNLVVTNIAPTASLATSRTESGLHAADVTLTLGGVSDPSGADTDAGFRHSFDFDNDGTWEVGDGTYAGGASSASASVPPQFLAPAGLRTFKARVTDKDGGSADRTVTVDVVAPPIVSTEPARSPSTNAATLFARVDAQSQPTVLLFEYGTAPDLAGAAVSEAVDAGSAVGPRELSLTVPGLRPHTAYHFRAVATNADGVVRGAIRSFETLNTAPVAVADAYDLAAAGPATLTVLANDTDADGDTLTVEVVSQSANAAVSVAPGGTGIVYDPADGFVGTDLLTYTVADVFGGRATADVTIRVADSQAPVFTVCAPSLTLDADASARAVVPDFFASSTVVDNVAVTVRTQSPAAGTSVGLGTNTVTLTARDAAGNGATCVATLVVRDVTAPTLAATGSEPVVQEWIQRFAGPGQSSESPRQVVLDADRNVYVLGDSSAAGNNDLLLLKYAFDGTLLWSRSYNGPGNGADESAGIAVSSRGGVFVAGTLRNAARRQDVVVQRVDPATGDLLWQTLLDGADGLDDRAAGLAVDAAGNVYVAAATTSTATGVDLLVAKLDPVDGAPLWRSTFDRGGTEAAARIVVDASGNPSVVGQGGSTNPDILTVQFSAADGSVRWSDLYDSSAGLDDRGVSIAVGSAGDLLVTGGSTPASGRFDMLTIRYRSADGARLWTSRHNGPGNQIDLPYALAVGAGGEAYVGGYDMGIDRETAATTLGLSRDNGTAAWTNRFQFAPLGYDQVSALEVDSDGGVLAFGAGLTETDGRTMDFLTRKLDPATGTNLWAHRVPGAEGNEVLARSMAVDGRGSVFLAGLVYERSRGADVLLWKLTQRSAGPALPSTVDADGDCGAAVPDLLARVTASDAGGSVALSQSPAAGTRVSAGQWPIVVTATDPSGNATRQTNVFSVVDRVAPVFAGGVADVFVCSTNGAGAVATFTLPTATDSCSVPVVTSDRLSGSVFPVGTTVVTVTAEDASGNRATTTFRVRVNRPPVAAPYSLSVVNNTNVTLTVSRLLGTVNDPDGDAVVVTSVATRSRQGGTVAYNGTNIVYTPPAGFVGGDSFTVNVTDGGCAEVVDTVAVDVTAPQGDLAGATFYVRGARFEVARYKRHITREVWQSLDNGVTWRHLGTIGATGSRTFVIYYTTPAAGHYRFL